MKGVARDYAPAVDPRVLGCQCDSCPFVGRVAVLDTVVRNPRLVVVAECPGSTEQIEGAPLVGPSGALLNRNLERLDARREDVFAANATLCPSSKKTTPAEWKKAIECCRPRLERELAELPVGTTVLAIGGKALQTLTDKGDKIELWRGAPLPGRAPFQHLTILPTIHPSYILRFNNALEPVFRIDLRRALYERYRRWSWPERIIDEGQAMEEALRHIVQAGRPTAIDVETAGKNPFESGLRCIGVGTTEVGVSVPWPPRDPVNQRLVEEILFSNSILKIFHNATYDLLALKHTGPGVVRGPIFDTLRAHAIVANKLPHNLGFVASCEFPAPRWKSEFKDDDDDEGSKCGADWATRDQFELRLYNTGDVILPANLYPVLMRRLERTHRGMEQYERLMRLQNLGMRMQERGVLRDPVAQERHRQHLTGAMAAKKSEFLTLCPLNHTLPGKELKTRCHVYIGPYRLGENGAHADVRRLFFKRLKVRPLKRTDSGQASIDDEVMQHIIANCPSPVNDIARTILDYRQYQKLLSTYVDGLPVHSDGVVRPVWKDFGTATGRLASQDPNGQNLPAKMRDIFIPRPGNVFVAADYKQLEGKIAAQLSGDELLLEWYVNGKNVYLETARRIWGEHIKKDTYEYKAAKQAILLMNYGGGLETMHRQMLRKGLKVTLKAVTEIHDAWFRDHPKLKLWQDEQIRSAHDLKYVEGPLSGRRIYFHLGQIEPTIAVNHPVQDSAAQIKNDAMLKVDELLNWEVGESIAFDVHDELVLEGPNRDRLIGILRRCMERTIALNGTTLHYGIDCESGPSFGTMVSVAC